jgi:hypothetical protein
MSQDFDPTDPNTWRARGRTAEHAEAIAEAWRTFPDLPADAPAEARMNRGRERIAAMRPINDAIRDAGERERQATNFAFTEDQVRRGKGNDRDIAVLRGRTQYGYSWDVTNRYADGWYAAHVGWPHHYPDGIPSTEPLALRRAAYDQGFTDGGGDRTDLFDAARRTNLALLRESNFPPAAPSTTPFGRPLPSTWPKPSDDPRPTRWSRRLVILDEADTAAEAGAAWNFLDMIHARPGAEAATIVVLTKTGFALADTELALPNGEPGAPLDVDQARRQLRDALTGHEFDDILIALQDASLDLIDRVADALPLCRAMERTRNTRLQQRTHLRTWLDRGHAADTNMAAGHIRWSKVIHGLRGSLGEFSARHIGPAPGGGHLIRVETTAGVIARGYANADGSPLSPEIVVSSKARLRPTIATTLRTFAAATALMGTLDLQAA